jgi:hypothetical protein
VTVEASGKNGQPGQRVSSVLVEQSPGAGHYGAEPFALLSAGGIKKVHAIG